MNENSISVSDFTILGFFDGKFDPEDIATINDQDLTATGFQIRQDDDLGELDGSMKSLFATVSTGGYEFEAEFPLTSPILRDIAALMVDAQTFPLEFKITHLGRYSGNIVMRYADPEPLELTA